MRTEIDRPNDSGSRPGSISPFVWLVLLTLMLFGVSAAKVRTNRCAPPAARERETRQPSLRENTPSGPETRFVRASQASP